MRPKRNRHHFHTFAFTDAEESVLQHAQNITGDNLTNILIRALQTFIPEKSPPREKHESESQSMFDQLAEFFNISL
jgi:hypothetical protein